MGHVAVGHRWDRVAMDLWDMSVTTAKGNRYVLVMVDCFFQMDGGVPVARQDSVVGGRCFLSTHVCRFAMPMVIHSDQGQEFENKVMQELCLRFTYNQDDPVPSGK